MTNGNLQTSPLSILNIWNKNLPTENVYQLDLHVRFFIRRNVNRQAFAKWIRVGFDSKTFVLPRDVFYFWITWLMLRNGKTDDAD